MDMKLNATCSKKNVTSALILYIFTHFGPGSLDSERVKYYCFLLECLQVPVYVCFFLPRAVWAVANGDYVEARAAQAVVVQYPLKKMISIITASRRK